VSLANDRRNIVVTGATGAGKTTLFNALAERVATNERIIRVEDAVELRLDHPHVVRLETRQATTDGLDSIDQRALLRAALSTRVCHCAFRSARRRLLLRVRILQDRWSYSCRGRLAR
jgi:pilus assembly protein CpaF